MVMRIELISHLLFGAGIACFIRNIWDYSRSIKQTNYDAMGAMINWHYGFHFSWFLVCLAVCIYPGLKWYFGLIAMPFSLIFTYIFWYPIHILLIILQGSK